MMKWIDNYIVGIKEVCNSDNLYEVLDYLDIEVKRVDSDYILLAGHEAYYLRSCCEVIFIKDNLDINYEKFILAHELGHAIIHTHLDSASFNKSEFLKSRSERQANYFALQFLDLNFKHYENEGFSMDQLSAKYGIPVEILTEYLIE